MEIPVILLAALAAAAIAAVAFTVKSARQRARRQEMAQLTHRLGLSYSEEDFFGLIQQLKDFDLFRRERRWIGRRGRIRNVLRGQVGDTEVYLFDYTYVIQAGNTPKRITQTVFFASDRSWYLPNFKLKPETWWHKVRALFDKSDIDFPESPDFSGKFWVTGDFAAQIHKTFGPEVQQFLMERPPVHLEGNNFYLLAYKPRRTLQTEDAVVFFEHCCQLVKQLKHPEGKLELLSLSELTADKEKIPGRAGK